MAGQEEIRAIMTFQPAWFGVCVAAAGRLGWRAADMTVQMFARLNSPELLTHLSALEAAHASDSTVSSALKVLVEGNPALLDRLVREFAGDPIAIEVALGLRTGKDPSFDRVVASLVKSDNEDVRIVTVWYLARLVAEGGSLTPEIDTAIDPVIAGTTSRVTFEALGLELLARASHRPRHERRWTNLTQPAGRKLSWNRSEEGRLFGKLLSDQEVDDLGSVFNRTREMMLPLPGAKPAPFVMPRPSTDFSVRSLPRGDEFTSELLKLSGCEVKPDRKVIAEVHYRPEGRPSQISIASGDSPEPCVRAARVRFAMTVSRAAKPMSPTFTDVLVLPLEPQRIECVEDAAAPSPSASNESSPPPRVGGPITQPSKIENVNPVYPIEAQKKRIQGVVIVESTISPAGCVSEAAVLSSPDPMLSAAALTAVMGWRYTPTLLNDVAVPVIMTVTVNFTLRR